MDLGSAKTLYVIARGIDYFGMAVFLGGLLFLALLWPHGSHIRRARVVVTAGWVLGLIGTLAAIGLYGAWIAGRGPSAMLDTQLLGQTLDERFGQVWFAKGLLWILAGVVLADLLQRGERAVTSLAWRIGAVAVAAGLVRATGLIGHATETDRPVLSQVADFAHLVGICAWLGGLVLLLVGVVSRRDPDDLARVVPRYSRLAMISMAVIVTGGVILAWQTVGSADRLFSTSYGELLLIKLALIAAILFIASRSRSWIARRLDFAVVLRGDAATVRPFFMSVAAETTIVLVVLLAASLLVTASPGQ